MSAIESYFEAHWLQWLIGFCVVVLTWAGTNWLGKPLLDFLADRQRTLEAHMSTGKLDDDALDARQLNHKFRLPLILSRREPPLQRRAFREYSTNFFPGEPGRFRRSADHALD